MYGKLLLFSYSVFSRRSVRCYKENRTKKLLEFLATMPKDTALKVARTNAQRQRHIIAKKWDKYTPSSVYLQVVGSGAIGVPNTLYLFTDQKRYLFNCGEGTQRLAHEHKVKLSRLENIFITSKTWKHIGGLPGLSLTLQDVGVPHITLHGPEGLDELYAATERFIVMKDMNVKMATCSPSEDFEDNVMTVKYIHQGPTEQILVKETVLAPAAKKPKLCASLDKEFQEFIHDDTDYYMRDIKKERADINKTKDKDVKEKVKPKTLLAERDPMKKKTEKVLEVLQKRKTYTVSYICTLKKRLGTLDLNKCVELGVKPGPLLGKLKNGEDVVLPDGTLVLSKDVKTPDDPGPVFIVLDVPNISYLKESEFSAHFDNGVNSPDNIPMVIVHYSPPDVIQHPTYQAFMTMFGSTTQHLIVNSQNSCLGSEAVHRTQNKLHLLDNDIFPLLKDVSIPTEWNIPASAANKDIPAMTKALEDLKNKIALAQFQSIINMESSCKGDGTLVGNATNQLQTFGARSLTMYHLRPNKQDRIDRSAEPKLHIKEYIEEAMTMDGFTESLEKFRQLVDNVRYKGGSGNEYPKIVFLGTGSCIPSKTRNTSGIVIHLNEQSLMLLDCGEGTFNQMVRFYGSKRINSLLRTLKAIYISHLHADHHIGLIGVLQARRLAFQDIDTEFTPDPVYLLAPGQIMSWLSIYDQQFEKIRGEFTLIPNQDLLYNLDNPKSTMTSAILANIGAEQIRTCQVRHCPNAFGVAIQLDGQYKITYSGDTIPCDELVHIGEKSTVLIHEATMEDELAHEARFKMHSTTSQAIDVGRRMCARHTVLTHFSQRYARLPRLNHLILNDNNTVGIAFDNMQITMSDLELLPHMYAPLQLMFAEHCLELELKAELRAKKEQLKERRSLSSSLTSCSDNEAIKNKVSPRARPAITATTSSHVKHEEGNASHKKAIKNVREVSQGRRTTMSAPASHAKYRESNASRLRQELKGMTISGTVGRTNATPNYRSKSLSPSRLYKAQQESSEQVTENAIPLLQQQQRQDTKDIDTSQTQGQSTASNPPRKTQDRSESSSNASSRIVINTVSRTITDFASNARYSRDRCKEKNESYKKLHHKPESSPALSTDSIYGKPLVTPVNTKLVTRRDQQHEQLNMTERVNHSTNANASRARTPVRRCKAQNGTPSLPTSPKRPYISDAKSLNKAFAGYTRPSTATNVKTDKPFERKNKPLSKQPPKNTTASSFRDTINENVKKQSSDKDKHAPTPGRPNPVLSSQRSFRPQLEDIQSSYLLLNKVQKEKNAKEKSSISDKTKNVTKIPRPKPLNEQQRKEKLYATRKKYQTKEFWDESRYDKIEGLNWISWK